jgi:hypothetical protein
MRVYQPSLDGHALGYSHGGALPFLRTKGLEGSVAHVVPHVAITGRPLVPAVDAWVDTCIKPRLRYDTTWLHITGHCDDVKHTTCLLIIESVNVRGS